MLPFEPRSISRTTADDSSDSQESGVMICDYGSQSNWRSLNAPDYLDIPRRVIGILNQNDIVPVVLPEEKCCGHDALWRGDVDTFKKLAEFNVNAPFLLRPNLKFWPREICVISS